MTYAHILKYMQMGEYRDVIQINHGANSWGDLQKMGDTVVYTNSSGQIKSGKIVSIGANSAYIQTNGMQLADKVPFGNIEANNRLGNIRKGDSMLAKILKWTPEGEAKAQAARAAHLAANPTSHADSIPRGKRDEANHQKELNLDTEKEPSRWHTVERAKMRDHSNAALKYIQQDTTDAINANPDNPKAGQYMDTRSYAGMEMKARQNHRAGIKKEESVFSTILKYGVKGMKRGVRKPKDLSAGNATSHQDPIRETFGAVGKIYGGHVSTPNVITHQTQADAQNHEGFIHGHLTDSGYKHTGTESNHNITTSTYEHPDSGKVMVNSGMMGNKPFVGYVHQPNKAANNAHADQQAHHQAQADIHQAKAKELGEAGNVGAEFEAHRTAFVQHAVAADSHGKAHGLSQGNDAGYAKAKAVAENDSSQAKDASANVPANFHDTTSDYSLAHGYTPHYLKGSTQVHTLSTHGSPIAGFAAIGAESQFHEHLAKHGFRASNATHDPARKIKAATYTHADGTTVHSATNYDSASKSASHGFTISHPVKAN